MGHFKSRKEREAELAVRAKEFTNVYVKNFGDDVDDDTLRDIFRTYGQSVMCRPLASPRPRLDTGLFLWRLGNTTSARVMMDEHGSCRGFGFVSFARHEDAQKVKQNGRHRSQTLH